LNNLFVPPLFLDILLLKNPMNLTDEQWRLIEPILPPPSPSDRGRHPLRYSPGVLRDAARESGAFCQKWRDN
jgi:transposase